MMRVRCDVCCGIYAILKNTITSVCEFSGYPKYVCETCQQTADMEALSTEAKRRVEKRTDKHTDNEGDDMGRRSGLTEVTPTPSTEVEEIVKEIRAEDQQQKVEDVKRHIKTKLDHLDIVTDRLAEVQAELDSLVGEVDRLKGMGVDEVWLECCDRSNLFITPWFAITGQSEHEDLTRVPIKW